MYSYNYLLKYSSWGIWFPLLVSEIFVRVVEEMKGESLVVVNVDSKRIVRDGTEERETSSSITKCRKNNHLIQPGETFRVVMEHVFCERDYFSIPTLSSVQFEFRSQLGYVVEINPIQ